MIIGIQSLAINRKEVYSDKEKGIWHYMDAVSLC